MAKKCRQLALDLLARREHSRLELSRKLSLRDFSLSEINQCLDQLVTDKLLSDERFAEAYVKMRSRAGFGPQRIVVELQQRGVAAELAERTLQDIDWNELAQQVYQKKYAGQPCGDFKERAKRMQFLSYRGFNGYLSMLYENTS